MLTVEPPATLAAKLVAWLARAPAPARRLLLASVSAGAAAALLSSRPAKADAAAAAGSQAAPAQPPGAHVPKADAAGGPALLPALAAQLGLRLDNQFASGGLTLMLIGAAAAAGGRALSLLGAYAKRAVCTVAEVDSRDDAYRWLVHWMSRHERFARGTQVSITTNLNQTFGTSVMQQGPPGGEAGPRVSYLPAPGDHLLRFRGKLMLISRRRAAGNPQLAANARLLLETLRISMLGTDRSHLEALVDEARAAYHASQAGRTLVHSVDPDGYWTPADSRAVRPLATVVLPHGQAEALLRDCQEFLASERWYAHRGIPYRRGFLLHGPPGTGKTSLVMALAGALGLDIYAVTLSSPAMTDENLRHLLNTAGTRSILLLEDVDAAGFNADRSSSSGAAGGSRLTFSGLLNAIDGVAAQEGRLLFLTTNHMERLNSALIRPGRVDVRVLLPAATRSQARDLFLAFFRDTPAAAAAAAADEQAAAAAAAAGEQAAAEPGELSSRQAAAAPARSASLAQRAASAAATREAELQSLASAFAGQLPADAGLSMAALQGFFMLHRKDAAAAADPANVAALLAGHASQQAPAQGAAGEADSS